MNQKINRNEAVVYNWKIPNRLLNDEIGIIESAFDSILISIERSIKRITSFTVCIEKSEEPKIISFSDLPNSTKLQFLSWSASLERKEEKFAMLWDASSISPLLYGVLGGSLANAIHRIDRKETEITDIEIGILFDLIIECFLKPIFNGFSSYHQEFKPRIDAIEPESHESLQLFPKNEICLVFPLIIKWKEDSNDFFTSQSMFIFSQSFLRQYQWRLSYGKI
ncbi:hypothetical protein [Leptospira levettii]|uniref:hypothetical protein n=1 Tax=Leptospira levettii TaxID=2023178 RepID=UPI003EBBF6CD